MSASDPKRTLASFQSAVRICLQRLRDAGRASPRGAIRNRGADEDGCVWACSPEGRDVWCRNLGPKDKVVEVLSQWLGKIDADEIA